MRSYPSPVLSWTVLEKCNYMPIPFSSSSIKAPWIPAWPTCIFCLINGLCTNVFTFRILKLSSPHTARKGNDSPNPGSGKAWVLWAFASLESLIRIAYYQLFTKNMWVGKDAMKSLFGSYSSRYIGNSFTKLIDSVSWLYTWSLSWFSSSFNLTIMCWSPW